MAQASTAQTAALEARARAAGTALKSLESQVQTEVAETRKRVVDRSKHVAELKATASEIAQAIATKQIDKAALLTANFKTAAASREAMQKTQRGAMIRLAEQLQGAKSEITQMTKLTPEEQKLITDAEEAVKSAERILEGLRAEHTASFTKTKLFGIRARAIASAESAITKAEANIVTLKAAVETQRTIANTMKDARVDTVTLDQAMTHILTATKDAVNMAKDDLVQVREELQTTTDNRVRTEELLTQYSGDRVEVEGKLAALNSQIKQLEDELRDLAAVKGTPAWVEKNNLYETKKVERVEVEGNLAKALELYRTAEAAKEAFITQENGLQVHIQCIELEVSILEANVRDQMAEIQAFAINARSSQSLQSLHLADDVGRDMRMQVAESTSQFVVSALAKRAERAESMPAHVQGLKDINAMTEQAATDSDARIAAQIELLKEMSERAVSGAVNN